MSTLPIIQRYIWLVNTIARFDGRLTFGEISRKWAEAPMNDGSQLSRSTFYRYREGIRELFGIALECDAARGNVYYIAQDDCDGRLQTWSPTLWGLPTWLARAVRCRGASCPNIPPRAVRILSRLLRPCSPDKCCR